jgi:hypothetical protein
MEVKYYKKFALFIMSNHNASDLHIAEAISSKTILEVKILYLKKSTELVVRNLIFFF